MAYPNQNERERSLGELFAELSRETSALVRSEVALAKTELSEKAARAGRDAGMVAAGGALAHAGLLTIVAAVVLLLAAAGLPAWLAAVVAGIVVAGIGYAVAQKGLTALKREDLTPRQTMDSVKETAQWAKNQTR
jgi:VIT1/CCC1 family predicted Fe2+/Mn2+ transporter